MAPLILAGLLLAGGAFADEVGDIVAAANQSHIGKTCVVAAADRFCSDEASCATFCDCACTFDSKAWGSVEHETKCPNAPRSGSGMLAFNDPALLPIPALGRYVTGNQNKKATQAVIDGLRAIETYLETEQRRAHMGYHVRIATCYRPAVGDPTVGDGDTEKECSLILSARYMLAKPLSDAQKDYWTLRLNPPALGLTWPGSTPHSAGFACDLVLVDAQGQDSFDWRAGVDGAPHSSIDQRLASSIMDEIVTQAGGKRLDYEAWHYEWGGPDNCRCAAPDCAQHHWPPTGAPNCR